MFAKSGLTRVSPPYSRVQDCAADEVWLCSQSSATSSRVGNSLFTYRKNDQNSSRFEPRLARKDRFVLHLLANFPRDSDQGISIMVAGNLELELGILAAPRYSGGHLEVSSHLL